MAPKRSRELTGRTVLICFIGFFAVVAAVNGIMIRAAVSTFAGTETDSAYRAGLAYKGEEAAALAQDALHWQVNGKVERATSGDAVLSVDVRDAMQNLVPNVDVTAHLAHPLNARLDRRIVLTRASGGQFRGESDAAPGQWTLTIEVMRGDDRVYRSTSRVVLK